MTHIEELSQRNRELQEALRSLLDIADAHDAPAWNWESADAVEKARKALEDSTR